jgi:adenosylmethionine-8-amino-7-oxononanoate aminotransferase
MEVRLREGLACLSGLPGVVDVRCKGALGVVQLDRWAERDSWVQHFVDMGVWLRPFRDVVYCAPPLVIQTAELDQLIDAMVAGTRRWTRGDL